MTQETTSYYRIPYFYIIRHKPSGKLYAGSKYGKDANPNLFMIDGGYTTSSPKINKLIASDGIDSFEVVQIIPEDVCGIDVFSYETRFLIDNNIAKRKDWINAHNNYSLKFGSDEFKEAMQKLYGVDHPSQLEEVKDKKKQSYLKHYGVESPTQSDEIKNKIKETCIEKYGVQSVLQAEEVKRKISETNIERYGAPNPQQNANIRQRTKETNMERYGVEYPVQSQKIREATKNSTIEKYGYEYYTQRPEWKKEYENVMMERHGVTNGFHMIPKVECIYCGKITPKGNHNRWHGENCKFKTVP